VVLEGEAGGEDEGICNRRRRGSGQRQHHQRAYVKGTARASGIADAAQATRSASAKGAQRWAFQLKGFANKVQNTSSTSAECPSPAVSPDGATVFVGSGALDATTGEQRWAFDTGDYLSSSPAVSHDGATVFVGSDDKNVYALNAKTGVRLWAFPTGNTVHSSPAVSPDGSKVFVGSDDKNVYALNAKTGVRLWAFPTGNTVHSSPAVSPDGSTVFVGSDDKNVYALNATKGTRRWAFDTGNWVRSSPAVSPDGSTVFVGSDDKNVYALNAKTGAQLWAFPTGNWVRSSPAVSPDGSTVFVGSDDKNVYALNATKGTLRWAFATGNWVRSSPAVRATVSPDSTVFVGSDDKNVYALNAKTGAQLWAFPTGGAVRSSPAVSPDGATVFVSSHDAQVYALNSNPQVQNATENFFYEIRINLSLPMSLSNFTKHKQKVFKASLAQAVGRGDGHDLVASEAVFIKIESISSRRRLLAEAIRVETSIMTTKGIVRDAFKEIALADAMGMAGRLTADSINSKLSMACPQLPTATVLEAAKVVAVTQWPSPTKEAECEFTNTVMAQLPILFLCGLAYLGVKSKCSFAPKKPEAPKMLPEPPEPATWASPRQTNTEMVVSVSNSVQTSAVLQDLDEDASKWERIQAAGKFAKDLFDRLIFIVPRFLAPESARAEGDCDVLTTSAATSNFDLYLYGFDLWLLCYFAWQQRYCPRCLYNNLHVLITKKKLKPLFDSKGSRRFSGTAKMIVGVSAIATVTQVVEVISKLWCFFTAEKYSETPWHKNPPQDIATTFAKAAGVLSNSLATLVAVVATVTFYSFATVACVRFYLSAVVAYGLCQAKSKLRTQQSNLEHGVDQRNTLQKVGGVFSSQYSKDSVNQHNVENAEREVESLSSVGGKKCCGFSIPDLGSNEGTCMYNFWALIWESL